MFRIHGCAAPAALALALSTGLVLPAAAEAASVTISGSRQHVNIIAAGPSGRCPIIPRSPPYIRTVTIEPGPGLPSSSGTMDPFGPMVPTMSHCVESGPPTLFGDGIFTWEFANGDLLEGSYAGEVLGTADPNFFTTVTDYVLTGGTGRFLGASGSIFEEGSFRRGPRQDGVPGGQTRFSGTFAGQLDLPAIPEPASWALMIMGFGAVGVRLRRRRFPGTVTA
jgi:hypothetical protein